MPDLVSQTLRNRWVVFGLHGALWLLLYLVLVNLGGKPPAYTDSPISPGSTNQSLPPMTQLAGLFASTNSPTNRFQDPALMNPFVTKHFVPAPAPAPPPPPTTRKVELTYLGFYQTEGGQQQTMIQFTNAFLVAPVGGKVLSNLFVSSVTMQSLALTNTLAQTNVLPVNVKKVVEVPLQ
jgi:hypothetical protein